MVSNSSSATFQKELLKCSGAHQWQISMAGPLRMPSTFLIRRSKPRLHRHHAHNETASVHFLLCRRAARCAKGDTS